MTISMSQSMSHLTQSQYYSPTLNAAIFDGPVRIYFSQHQEALALNVYFKLQKAAREIFRRPREWDGVTQLNRYAFVMLYPSSESFALSFPNCDELMATERLNRDLVIGLSGPLTEIACEKVILPLEQILKDFTSYSVPAASLGDLSDLATLPEDSYSDLQGE